MHGVPYWLNRGMLICSAVMLNALANRGVCIYKHDLVSDRHNGRVISLKSQNKCQIECTCDGSG